MPVRSLALATLLGIHVGTMTSRAALAQNAPQGPLVLCQSGNYAVSVTPDGTARSWTQYTVSHPDTFKVTNTSVDCGATFLLSHTETLPILGVGLNKTSVTLNPGAWTTVIATYDVGQPGSGVLTLKAVAEQNSAVSDTGYFNVTVVTGAPSNWDVTPFNHDNQDVGRCAAACFAATFAQSTVPYFSLDAPRSVTLAYNSDRVWPKPFIHLNLQKPSGSVPDTILLQVKKAGVWQTFVSGDSLLKFVAAPSGWQRIGGQLRDSTWATNMYDVDIVVTWHYPGGSTTVQTWTTKVLVVNETNSPIARGWTMAGVQRAYPQTGNSILITEGDGSAVFFRKRGATTFFSPTGEFSTVVVNGTGWKRLYPDSTVVYFNSAGRMTDVYDRFSNRTQLLYDGSNRDTTIRDPNLQDLRLAYGPNGLSWIRDNFTPYRYTNVTVASDSTLTAIQDPDGVSTRFQYDSNRRLWKIVNRRGDTTTVAYQAVNGKITGKLATVTAPTVAIYGEGSVAPMTILAPWQTVGVPYSSAPVPVVLPDTVYARVTDPGSHTTRFTVNRWGTAAAATDALGRTDSTRFDTNGLPVRERSASGAVDTAVYDAMGLPTYAKRVGMPAARVSYAAWAQPDSAWTDDGLFGARYFIGANGRVDSVRVAGGTSDAGTTRYTYESHGRPATVRDPLQHSVQSTQYLGTNGNRSQDALPGNRVTTYGYDAYGRITTVSQPGLAVTTTYYSMINRADSVRDGVNPIPARYGYDNLFLRSVTDPKGQVYAFNYNAVGWLTHRIDPVGDSDQYQYDRDGQLRRWTNRRAQPIDYIYDAVHRRMSKSGTNTATESWSYPSDTVVVATSAVAVDTILVNRQGQLLRASTVMAGQNYVRRYAYTAAGALDSVIPSGAGIVFQARRYIWNLRRGTLTDIKLGAGPASTALAYTADGLMASTTLPGGDVVGRTYNSLHVTADVTTSASYSATVNRSSGFDDANRIERQITSPTQGHQFSYDSLGRLIADSLIQSNGGTPCDPHNPPNDDGDPCTFDPIWSVLPSGASTFSYDSAGNRRDLGGTYTTGNRITGFGGCTYLTDLDGNVTSRTCGSQTVTFTWTAESRLASLTALSQTTTFDYNASGRLVRTSKPGLVHHFVWERDNLLAELDSAGTGKIAEYSYYPGLDNPHALIVGNAKYFAHRDIARNVIALTDSTSFLARTYDFSPFGQSLGGNDFANLAGKDRARFKGALSFGDGLEDLYYMRSRWYEPRTGRFLSEDPVGLAGGINLYTFSGDDPINGRDPDGLVKVCTEEGVLYYWYYPDTGTWEFIKKKVTRVTCSDIGGAGGGGGGIAPPGVCRVQTLAGPIEVDASIAQRAAAFVDFAVLLGVDVHLSDSFRTTREQGKLYVDYMTGKKTDYPVARPWTSYHEAGFGIDISWKNLSPWSKALLSFAGRTFGFQQLRQDLIHWQFTGGWGPYGSKTNAIIENQLGVARDGVGPCPIPTGNNQ